jgi:hypothetical protein
MRIGLFVVAASVVALSACVPRPAPPPPATPEPQPRPQPRPPEPIPAPPPAQWEDAPLASGDWSYRDGPPSQSSFGIVNSVAFAMRCDRGRGIILSLAGEGRSPLTIRTTYGARSVAAEQSSGALVATLPASDPLLDQIAFSRGRFAVEAAGGNRLIMPAWPETARVIEDCRG